MSPSRPDRAMIMPMDDEDAADTSGIPAPLGGRNSPAAGRAMIMPMDDEITTPEKAAPVAPVGGGGRRVSSPSGGRAMIMPVDDGEDMDGGAMPPSQERGPRIVPDVEGAVPRRERGAAIVPVEGDEADAAAGDRRERRAP